MSDFFVHPSVLFILGAVLLPFFRKVKIDKIVLVLIPVLAFWQIRYLPELFGQFNYLGFDVVFGKVDKLTYVFLHVFTLMAIIGAIYGLKNKDTGHQIAAMLYVAGSLGVTLAGDYLTLFIFWELMAFASTFLVWYRKKKKSIDAGYRYLLVHMAGGLILLGGIFLRYKNVHDLSFTQIIPADATLADYLILIGFALNAAVPPIHAWLPDAYPEATVTGAVFMCAFTTKTAVYVLARAFPGFEVLAVLGAVMTLYGVGYAIIENDARRILAYHIVSQVGYMVCGVGIGTVMAINGACAHAYAHIIYKALLFMGAGAVLEMTGKSKLSELGGLWKYMPISLIFTVIGGISISGFPLTSGFVSKSMIVAAAGESHRIVIMLMLLLASVGTFLSVGVKLPYFIWFGKDSGVEAKEAPLNMHIAMGIAAFLCIFIGVYPEYLYNLLPYATEYKPYTSYHLSESMQLLGFTGLGFYLLLKKMQPKDYMNLDVDWFYRNGARVFMWIARKPIAKTDDVANDVYRTVGLKMTMLIARFMSWFDWRAIDGFIDGSAAGVVKTGDKVRNIQTGRLQQYIGAAAGILFAVIMISFFI